MNANANKCESFLIRHIYLTIWIVEIQIIFVCRLFLNQFFPYFKNIFVLLKHWIFEHNKLTHSHWHVIFWSSIETRIEINKVNINFITKTLVIGFSQNHYLLFNLFCFFFIPLMRRVLKKHLEYKNLLTKEKKTIALWIMR